MEMNEYIPRPRDTQGIELPESLKGLSEAMAAHTHELWTYQQYLKGWRYAPENDNKEKKTPKMVPYDKLPDVEKEDSLMAATEALKFIYLNGYEIQNKKNETNYNPVKKGWKWATVILIFFFLLVLAFVALGAVKVCIGTFPSTNEVYMSIIYLVIACAFLLGITKIILKLIALYTDVLRKEHEVLSELYTEEQKKEIIRKNKNRI
ncbi:RyR domain-containing protein [Bacteroides bouchesdurhonensis]|uniref:RyR domain-containing protein n=1 Tax=Bacteroides bouchesdurhonensis TaxID=1841855 RepID=UPI00097F8178|nr:RyR domain-containing protein [Bacteroides bouchesdurhonensis]